MTLGKRRFGKALRLIATVICAGVTAAGAADQDGRAAAWQQQLAAARTSYYADLGGDHAADAEARQRFAALVRDHPHDPTIQAYEGSLQLLEAGRTWALWRKHTLSMDGLAAMDSAVNADPNNLEARFVRALTTWHLPFFFHRKEEAEADLLFLGPRSEHAAQTGALPPQLAAAALDYWGQVLGERNQKDAARKAYAAAVRVDKGSPGGQDAQKRLQ